MNHASTGAILAPDAAIPGAPMSKRTPSQEIIDLDFSDYGRSPRQALGRYALGYFAGLALIIICAIEWF